MPRSRSSLISSTFSFSMAAIRADRLRGSTQLMLRISGWSLFSSNNLDSTVFNFSRAIFLNTFIKNKLLTSVYLSINYEFPISDHQLYCILYKSLRTNTIFQNWKYWIIKFVQEGKRRSVNNYDIQLENFIIWNNVFNIIHDKCWILTPCLTIFFSILRNKHYLLGL